MTIGAVVTGMGICSPIGHDFSQVADALENGRSGIREIQSFDCSQLTMKHAGEVDVIPIPDGVSESRYYHWDRGTRMAVFAASQAITHSGILNANIPSHRIGVVIGTSGSGQYQNARFQLNRTLRFDRELMFYLSRNSPHFQSSQVAAQLGLHGPNIAIGAATAGSGIALAVALSWLRNRRVDAVLVGGSESFSLLNVLGFDQLGLAKSVPCTPFSGEPGMTFGKVLDTWYWSLWSKLINGMLMFMHI